MTPSTPKSQLTQAQPPSSGAAGGAGLVSQHSSRSFFFFYPGLYFSSPSLCFSRELRETCSLSLPRGNNHKASALYATRRVPREPYSIISWSLITTNSHQFHC